MSQIKKKENASIVLSLIRIHRFLMCHLLDLPAAILDVYLPAPVSSHIAEDTQVLLLQDCSCMAAWVN